MPGDQILADRGFTLHDDFATVCGAELGKWQKTAYCQRGGVILTTGISTNSHSAGYWGSQKSVQNLEWTNPY